MWGDHQGNNSGYGQGSTLDAVIGEDTTSHIVNKIHPPRTFFDLHGTLTRLVHIAWFTGRVGRGVLPRKRACLPNHGCSTFVEKKRIRGGTAQETTTQIITEETGARKPEDDTPGNLLEMLLSQQDAHAGVDV